MRGDAGTARPTGGHVVLTVLAWAGVAFLAFMLIGCLITQVWTAALLFLAAGLLAAPPVQRAMGRKGVHGAIRITLAIVVAFVAMTVLVVEDPPPAPAVLSAPAPDEVAANVDATSAQSDQGVEDKSQISQEAKMLWQSVLADSKACDDASDGLAAMGDNPDVYKLYAATDQAQSICAAAGDKIATEKPPAAASNKGRVAFADAIEKCSGGQYLKASAYEKVKSVLDGDARPSAVNAAKIGLQDANLTGAMCAVAMFTAANAAGIAPDFLGSADARVAKDATK